MGVLRVSTNQWRPAPAGKGAPAAAAVAPGLRSLARDAVKAMSRWAPTSLLGPVEESLMQLAPDTVAAVVARLAAPGDKPKFEANLLRIAVRTEDDQYVLSCLVSLDFFAALNEAQQWYTFADDERIWDPASAASALRAAYVRLFRPGDYGKSYLLPQRIGPLLCAERLLEMLGGEYRTAFLPDYYRRLEAVADRLPQIQLALGAIFELDTLIGSFGKATLPRPAGLNAEDVLRLADMELDARARVIELVTEHRSYTPELAVLAAEEPSRPLLQGLL